MADKDEKPEIQTKTGKRGGKRKTSWKPGQSGNPNGCPTSPERREALAMLKKAAPDIVQKAFDLVLCEKPDSTVLRALIQKIYPDNLNLGSGKEALRIVIEKAVERVKGPE